MENIENQETAPELVNIVMLVDGEVAGNISLDLNVAYYEKFYAILKSAPTFIEHPRVDEGMLWDGEKFIEAE